VTQPDVTLLRAAAVKVREDGAELAKLPAPSLVADSPDVDAVVDHLGTVREMRIRYALAEVFDRWVELAETDPDLLNRVGGPETVILARAVLGEVTP
jgi:hypothetical protein